jgi:hypothetical protein
MVKSKTVIIWGREDMVCWSVELFLTRQAGKEVIRISDEGNVEDLIHEVRKVNPDVVIIHQGDYASDTSLPAQLLRDHPGLKVITVCMETNAVEVYDRHKVCIQEMSDLLSVIDADLTQPNSLRRFSGKPDLPA